MVSVLASNLVYLGFEERSGQTTDDKIDFCCSSAKLSIKDPEQE